MLERYGHGGDLRTAEETFGFPARQFIDFSSNMNPFGPPDGVRRALVHYAEQIDRYPDPAVRGLRAKLARLHRVDEQSILIGNGAAELIDLVVRALQPSVTALAYPCFTEYGDAVLKTGGSITPIMLSSDNSFLLTEPMVQESEANFYMIGSPNNPTGQLVDPSLLLKLVYSGATVVVDEAFMDFVPEEDKHTLIREASVHERLFVIRSMTKFYAVPGIRLGYMVGSPEQIAGLRRLQVPWSVNSLAQQIGEAVLEEKEYAARTMDWLLEERPWLIGKLEELGLRVIPGEVNYLLVQLPQLPGLTSASLQYEMGRMGILIRDASHFIGLDESYCRFAVKLRHQNEWLLEALERCLAQFRESSAR
ncbi:threonine-phosphate decarboxylase CobD [Paenibacillus glycanilyticus]|uniref:threonine-phosphate decarboxylase CobD n=1 Tax=Paenibacillus glycanilyticus TaxID=126569 RepID=UPI00204018B6|nr:threonine-phosphate decarboxylase CobD [Paenibacillus glycanilyticus]MCM3625847.1 threonine-phosphate decarboxylase CobD [Paenibacillus glycanilyticus]